MFRYQISDLSSRMIALSLIVTSLFFTHALYAWEIDLAEMYLEASTGNVQYKTPDDFLFSGDSYDNEQGVQILLGVPFKRADDNLVSVEAFYTYLGAAEDEVLANNILSEASVESSVAALGLRLGQKVGGHAFISTRFGVHYWSSEVSVQSVSTLTNTSLLNDSSDDDGLHLYGGLSLTYFISEHLFVSGGGQVLTLDIEGDDVYVTNYYLGIGAKL
ncbi:MAG TPA: hypothetical protein DCZ03_11270 [Gammaproteobacteria bacterium]|nr:hypothetical protein [Gammaproteobacteria bacterium]